MKEYSLVTIQDIFEKIPTDRIGLCMDELKTMLINQKQMIDLLRITAEELGKPLPETPFSFGKPLIWKDDGKGELVTSYCVDGDDEPLMTTKITRDPKI